MEKRRTRQRKLSRVLRAGPERPVRAAPPEK